MSGGLDTLAALCGHAASLRLPAEGGLLLGLMAAGATGSALHCGPMCGPFVLGQVVDRMARVPAVRLCEWQRFGSGLLLPYHLGRLVTYATLGAGAAASAAVLGRAPWFSTLSVALLLIAAALFLVQGLRRILPAAALPSLDIAPVGWSQLLVRVAQRINRTRPAGGFVLGLTLGFLPCGFLYAALIAAASSLDPLRGAAAMASFALGTMPGLMVVGIAGEVAGRRWRRGVALLSPAVMMANAVMLVVLAWQAA